MDRGRDRAEYPGSGDAWRAEGVWTLRWLEASTHPLPEVRVVRFADLGGC